MQNRSPADKYPYNRNDNFHVPDKLFLSTGVGANSRIQEFHYLIQILENMPTSFEIGPLSNRLIKFSFVLPDREVATILERH